MATNPLMRQAFGDPDPINPRASSFGDAAAASRDSSVQQVSTGAAGGPLSKLASSAQSRLAAPASGLETLGETTAPQGAANRMAGSGRSLVTAAGLGMNPGGQATQFQAPTVAHSGNDWTARENLRRMKMDANSLVHRSTWAPKGAGQAAANAYEKASLADHAAMTGGQAKASLETMQQNAGLLREGMQQSGENARRSLADMAGIQRESIQQEGAARRQSLADMASMDRTLVEQSGANERTGLEAQSKGLIAAMQAQAAARKAPEGYRYTADGTRMEAIPGGPSDPNASKDGLQQRKDSQDVFSIIDQANPLLQKATASYAGNAVDQMARVFGVSTEGGEAAAQLKALQGALVSKMPKMSGPQSDKDVLLYREMAGQIGDQTIPAQQRLAAMKTIEDLNVKYLPAVGDASAYQALQPGAYYKTPDGSVRRKQ